MHLFYVFEFLTCAQRLVHIQFSTLIYFTYFIFKKRKYNNNSYNNTIIMKMFLFANCQIGNFAASKASGHRPFPSALFMVDQKNYSQSPHTH